MESDRKGETALPRKRRGPEGSGASASCSGGSRSRRGFLRL